MTDTADENAYDQIPYPNYSHRETHPRHLEVIARLFGMNPPSINQSRVLELGCAAGWNLVPQAQDLPQSQFLGIDYSTRQIESGKTMVKQLGLKNIELRHADILDIDESWGQFDYIICHGIFSWVPQIVRTKIFEICSKNLVPNGVALVSYNVYPGWQLQSTIRDMMLYHIADREEPQERVTQARAVLDFLIKNCPQNTLYSKLFQTELARVSDNEDAQLLHDHLEGVNDPVYFHQFIEQAGAMNLQYLGDVHFSQMILNNLSSDARRTLGAVPLIQQEQYMDFLRNRSFRKTLLCHDDVKLERNLKLDILYGLHIAMAKPLEPARLQPDSEEPLRIKTHDKEIVSEEPVVKAAVKLLSEIWPGTMPFEELNAKSLEMLSPKQRSQYKPRRNDAGKDSKAVLASIFLEFMSVDLAECFVHPPRHALRPGEYPAASSVARFQALEGPVVTNFRHEKIKLNETERRIITQLDGSKNRQALIENLRDAAESGAMKVQRDGKMVKNLEDMKLSDIVNSILDNLNRMALLKP